MVLRADVNAKFGLRKGGGSGDQREQLKYLV